MRLLSRNAWRDQCTTPQRKSPERTNRSGWMDFYFRFSRCGCWAQCDKRLASWPVTHDTTGKLQNDAHKGVTSYPWTKSWMPFRGQWVANKLMSIVQLWPTMYLLWEPKPPRLQKCSTGDWVAKQVISSGFLTRSSYKSECTWLLCDERATPPEGIVDLEWKKRVIPTSFLMS